jgi:hypothetical protein
MEGGREMRTSWWAIGVCLAGLPATGGEPPQGGGSAAEAKFSTCFSQYALCISAPCTPTAGTMEFPAGSGKQRPLAACECEVMFGYNIGSTTCEERAAQQQGDVVLSTYSVAQTEGKPLLQCHGGTYADCFNMQCTVAADHPYRAKCVCPVLPAEGLLWITRGGQCRRAACNALWSGAPLSADLAINKLLWEQLGFTANPPAGYGTSPPMNPCSPPVGRE